ncbi:putative PSP1-like protein [Thermanaerovibrio velox DSM 12556]|uniref:Putative PSP1-like protein n=1 Tax=Thermanaerovibrio velox DSM 12556 TaxID=926567 RepID=H0URJ2_9BACT|nr:regulatory iron-sulfur-containing complex subunit RicT [Thermanaerovibrio velox]EHM09931.1 putative PSP1-like protein [Thermanaerovibrio velox DSM 12556]
MPKYLAVLGKPRYLGIFSLDDPTFSLLKGDRVMVSSPRGEETAVVLGTISEEKEEELRSMRSNQDMGDGVRSEPLIMDLEFVSTLREEELEEIDRLSMENDGALKSARVILEAHQLPMKIIDAEYLPNKKKLFFYFTSEQRVDFRALVKDLAKEFRTRIELRQVGVRDEAKIIRGLAPCGRPCCCSYWLHQFAPICIKMVKEQNLALNPTKISGLCGRLMCCMSYEHKTYRELWEDLPNPGSKIKTPAGNYVVLGVDLGSSSVRCSLPGGGEILVPVRFFEQFKDAVTRGEVWEAPDLPEEASIETGTSGVLFAEPEVELSVDDAEQMNAAGELMGRSDGAEGPSKKRRRRRKPKGGRDKSSQEGDASAGVADADLSRLSSGEGDLSDVETMGRSKTGSKRRKWKDRRNKNRSERDKEGNSVDRLSQEGI